jgi:porphobilinogen deaminase
MKIAFLHTSPVHVQTFDGLMSPIPEMQARHDVEEAWLQEAVVGGVSELLHGKVSQRLIDLAEDADLVVCTCSTLAPIVDDLARESIVRVDRPAMRRAAQIQSEQPVFLVVCLPSTVDSSLRLLQGEFERVGQPPNIQLVVHEAAWAHFQAGDQGAFDTSIAERVRAEVQKLGGVSAVVLAQAPMRLAAKHLKGTVITTPEALVAHIVNQEESA